MLSASGDSLVWNFGVGEAGPMVIPGTVSEFDSWLESCHDLVTQTHSETVSPAEAGIQSRHGGIPDTGLRRHDGKLGHCP